MVVNVSNVSKFILFILNDLARRDIEYYSHLVNEDHTFSEIFVLNLMTVDLIYTGGNMQ